MAPDIAQPGRPEQGVGHGMQQHIGVGMPQQAVRVLNGDAADDQRPARYQGVYVVALPDAEGKVHSHFSISSKSSGQVTLKLRMSPGTSSGACPAASMAEASSVTSAPAACACRRAARNTPARNICGVCASQRPLRSSVAATRAAPETERADLTVSATGSASK